MLKKIELENFTTFIKKTEFDFGATSYKFLEQNVNSNKILKSILFVGENASGKTQILRAIVLLLRLLFSNNDVKFQEYKSFYTAGRYFTLKYHFDIDNNEIIYTIKISIDKISSEKLVVNGNTIVDRIGNNAKFNYQEESTYEDLSDKLLFLRRIYFDTHFYNDKILNKWFDFLKNSIYVNCYTREVLSFDNNNDVLASEYLTKYGEDEINDFLDKINFNSKVKFSNTTGNENGFVNISRADNNKFLSFMKKGTDIYIPDIFESTGNITLINLLPSIIKSTNNNSMLIIDEFSSGFHNELEESLVKYFNYYSKNSQLFFVSHSTNLLDNTIMRPDQIYSISFKKGTGTYAKRFSSESPREAQNTEKMYLNGIFDGMPNYTKEFKDK